MDLSKNNIIRLVVVLLCIALAFVSLFVIAPKLEKASTYKGLTAQLDEKRESVAKLSLSMTALSVAVAAVPGDSTTPIADQIEDLNMYLLIAIGAIMIEKILLPILIGTVGFRIVLPVVAILTAIFIKTWSGRVLRWACTILVIGVLSGLLIPTGIYAGNKVDDALGAQKLLDKINKDIEEINKKNDEEAVDSEPSEDSSDEDKSFWDKIVNFGEEVGEKITGAGEELLEKAKVIMTDLMDAVVIFIISSCLIPIGVLLVLFWGIKVIIEALKDFIKVDTKVQLPSLLKKKEQ